MKNLIRSSLFVCALACVFTAATGAFAQNLVLNGGFDSGGTDWSFSGGGVYYYTDNGDTIASMGWWTGVNIYQNTGATIQPNTDYLFGVEARVGQANIDSVVLSLQDVSTGWTQLASQTFNFPDPTHGENTGYPQWYDFSFTIPAATLSAQVGDTLAVSVGEVTDSTYGWLHINSVSLEAVPEPTSVSLVLAALGAGYLVLMRRRGGNRL